MKTLTIRSIVATTILASGMVAAGELPFNAPATDRAQESTQLLHRAAYALQNVSSQSEQPSGGQKISDLWLFPTADTDTVFAQYRLSAASGNSTASTQHLSLLKLSGDQIIEFKELPDGQAASSSTAAQPTAAKDWTAAIGTGHAASSTEPVSLAGTPASLDWSASIGTGHAALSSGSSTNILTAAAPSNATMHWSSKFGTGRAFEAPAPVSKSSAVTAGSAGVNVDSKGE